MENPQIIFEDNSFLIIDKPSGLVVNRADTTVEGTTVQDWAETSIQNSVFSIQSDSVREFLSRSGIVHRLDKDTSGLLVIAKTPESFENLKNQFKSREVVKKYLALVHGEVEPKEGTINAPIERSPFNRKHFGIFPGGREAVTGYRVLRQLRLLKSPIDRDFSLVELSPHTGRTHQIRVHLKYINHPVVSDPVYGGRKQNRTDLKFCPRLFLHAAYLKIKHPGTGDTLEFFSELPSDLATVLKLLK